MATFEAKFTTNDELKHEGKLILKQAAGIDQRIHNFLMCHLLHIEKNGNAANLNDWLDNIMPTGIRADAIDKWCQTFMNVSRVVEKDENGKVISSALKANKKRVLDVDAFLEDEKGPLKNPWFKFKKPASFKDWSFHEQLGKLLKLAEDKAKATPKDGQKIEIDPKEVLLARAVYNGQLEATDFLEATADAS